MFSSSTSRNSMRAMAFFAVWMFFNSLSALSTLENSYSVGATNLTRHTNRRLLDVAVLGRTGNACKNDIEIYQGPSTPMPNGTPTYVVQIVNVCPTQCPVGGIHLTCGWFSSAVQINPRIFKRLKYNDCLANDGKPVKAGGSISFQYANTYPYPLAVASLECP